MEKEFILRKTNAKFKEFNIPVLEFERGYFVHKLLADENLNRESTPAEESLLDEKNRLIIECGFFERDFYSFDGIVAKIEEERI
jgi:hypothetical protein